jgi:hypothetical protein
VACWYSMLDVPPFTDVDKISTDPDIDAFAGDAATVTAAAVATTPAATVPTGTRPAVSSDGTIARTPNRRARHAWRRAVLGHLGRDGPRQPSPAIAARVGREPVEPAADQAIAHPFVVPDI